MGAPPQILLSTIGMWDSMFLMLLALVVFGPRRLPQIGRQIGKLMYEFRKASNDFKFQMEEELRVSEDADRRKKEEEERARQLALNPPAATQTIEAQADIGAAEQASVAAEPASSYPAEAGAVDPTSPETAEAEPGSRIYPRISPPSTGETVAAGRPSYYFESLAHSTEATPEPKLVADASADTPAVSAPVHAADLNGRTGGTSAPSSPDTDSPTPPKETVSQNG
jgi:sec-independent protein translocase protein TatB